MDAVKYDIVVPIKDFIVNNNASDAKVQMKNNQGYDPFEGDAFGRLVIRVAR